MHGKQQILIYPDIKWSIGTFGFADSESARAIVAAAEEEASPVGLCINADIVPWSAFEALTLDAVAIAERAGTPVEVSCSHMRSLEMVEVCLGLGFSTIMFDGSFLPFVKNVEMTTMAAEMAHRAGVVLEGEIGAIGDFGKDSSGQCMIWELAEKFAGESGIDSVTISIPGVVDETFVFDVGSLAELRRRISRGISLDDASLLGPQQILGAVAAGVSRLSFTACLRRVPTAGVRGGKRDLAWLEEIVRQKLRFLGASGLANSPGVFE